MRFDSYHCSKMRMSRKQRKRKQHRCREERQLHSLSFSFNNREEANAGQHRPTFLGGLVSPKPLQLLSALILQNQRLFQPSFILFAYSGPKIMWFFLPESLFSLYLVHYSHHWPFLQRKAFPDSQPKWASLHSPHLPPSPLLSCDFSSDHSLHLKLYHFWMLIPVSYVYNLSPPWEGKLHTDKDFILFRTISPAPRIVPSTQHVFNIWQIT